jgi:hypothetical protein
LAHHTGHPLFKWASIFYYIGLLIAWVVAAFGTTKGMITGYLLRPAPSSVTPIISVKEPNNPDDEEDDI